MKTVFLLFLCAFTMTHSLLQAQTSTIQPMLPPLRETFPIIQSKEGIVLFQTIMLGDNLVLPKGTILRNIFAMPLNNEVLTKREAQQKQMEQAYTRPVSSIKKPDEKLSPEQRAIKKRAHETIWQEKAVFLEALDRAHMQPLELTYIDPVDGEIKSSALSFTEGMLLVEQNNMITVASLEPESKADLAGFKVGDRILAIGKDSMEGDLKKFTVAYSKARTSKGIERPTIFFRVFRKDSEISLEFRPPISLNSSFFE